jgi:hypothetical protein
MKNNNRNILLATVVGIIVVVAAYVSWSMTHSKSPTLTKGDQQGDVVCTMDAKQCPDGIWVGRTGPNCEFVCSTGVLPIIGVQQGMKVSTKINQRVNGYSEMITPTAVIEDSRCPRDVQCIQAGTVRISLKLENTEGVMISSIGLGQTIETKTEKITFYSVGPDKISTTVIKRGDYIFVLQISQK